MTDFPSIPPRRREPLGFHKTRQGFIMRQPHPLADRYLADYSILNEYSTTEYILYIPTKHGSNITDSFESLLTPTLTDSGSRPRVP